MHGRWKLGEEGDEEGGFTPPPRCRIIINHDYLIIWMIGVLSGSHLQSQLVVLVSSKLKNPGERFDWSIDGVVVGKRVM